MTTILTALCLLSNQAAEAVGDYVVGQHRKAHQAAALEKSLAELHRMQARLLELKEQHAKEASARADEERMRAKRTTGDPGPFRGPRKPYPHPPAGEEKKAPR